MSNGFIAALLVFPLALIGVRVGLCVARRPKNCFTALLLASGVRKAR